MSIRLRYRALLKRALATSPFRNRPKYYRLGKYYVDYSEPTPAELDAIPNCDLEGFVSVNRSPSISRPNLSTPEK